MKPLLKHTQTPHPHLQNFSHKLYEINNRTQAGIDLPVDLKLPNDGYNK